jgi:hypothetical protein
MASAPAWASISALPGLFAKPMTATPAKRLAGTSVAESPTRNALAGSAGVSWLLSETGVPRRIKAAYLTDDDIKHLAAYAAQLRRKDVAA